MYNVSTYTEMVGNTPLLKENTDRLQETLDSYWNRGKIKTGKHTLAYKE